jgi:hypothetical protein
MMAGHRTLAAATARDLVAIDWPGGVPVPRFMDVAYRVRIPDMMAGHRTLAAATARDLVAIDWPRS